MLSMDADVCLLMERVEISDGEGATMGPLTLSLKPGETALVRADSTETLGLFCDVAQGLCPPASGRVTFEGVDWMDRDPDSAAADRGRMGRVFADGGWVSNLDVDENIYLRLRHHTRRSDEDIAAEAAQWASRFGFADVPQMRPAHLSAHRRKRAEWVRACMGKPALIMLEEPMRGVYDQHQSALLQALGDLRADGTSMVWLTTGMVPEGLHVTAEVTLNGERHDKTI
jgi:phospholipid/cholesterol/gamma-HCH transport system ATP-binding protein